MWPVVARVSFGVVRKLEFRLPETLVYTDVVEAVSFMQVF